jgi:hypothetical protein
MTTPAEKARDIVRTYVMHEASLRPMTFGELADAIAQALRSERITALEEAAKVAEECTNSYPENPAIDWFERSRRTGIRWGGEYSAMRIRALANEGGER